MAASIRNILLLAAAAVIVGAIFYFQSLKPDAGPSGGEVKPVNLMNREEKAGRYSAAVELVNPSGFLNAETITIGELVGKKVILVDFWTYSCINCQRTLPYLNAWHEKYKDKGLEIIGVHTPEFEFEKDRENVARAIEKFGIKYPVVQDNDYATWSAYANRYWPRKYLIDIDGFIIYDHIGEGAYAETERKIQEALAERAKTLATEEKINGSIVRPAGVFQVESGKVGSPETYFGSDRNEYFANGQPGAAGRQVLKLPDQLFGNRLYLAGEWNIQSEYAQNILPGARIIYGYSAKNVYLVASAEEPVKIKILVDGNLHKEIIVQADQLYHVVGGIDYGVHALEIIVENPGLKAFAFTFG